MCTLIIAVVLAFRALGLAQAYKQTNLASDIQGLAQNPPNGQPDTQLVNPCGLIASPTSLWWLSDNNAGVSTLDDGVRTCARRGDVLHCRPNRGSGLSWLFDRTRKRVTFHYKISGVTRSESASNQISNQKSES